MNLEDMHNYLTEASAVTDLKSFMVFGGEPMLYPSRAIAAFQMATELKVPEISMLTNGIWGRNEEEAERLAKRLKRSGLNKLGISVDAFHQQFIPLEHPKNAALASVRVGIEHVSWNVAVIKSISARNRYDKKTAQILTELEPSGIEAHVHRVIPVGRALTNLRRYFKPGSRQGPCEGDPILENPLTDPETITIEPSGKVDICWNLSIGNAKEKPLSHIIREYNWQDSPITRTLVEEGPISLIHLAKRNGFPLGKARYVNKCHLCIEVRKALELLNLHR
jgi:MoaA/NifB/PqqE/SkfB family radical SAM enzyme